MLAYKLLRFRRRTNKLLQSNLLITGAFLGTKNSSNLQNMHDSLTLWFVSIEEYFVTLSVVECRCCKCTDTCRKKCEFNVIRNEGTFDFSKYRKKAVPQSLYLFWCNQNNWNSNTG